MTKPDEVEEGLCPTCQGSGEGLCEGSLCYHCGGSGVIRYCASTGQELDEDYQSDTKEYDDNCNNH